MKKIYSIILGLALTFASISSKAQTAAMGYDFIDCAGNPQSLFADLDAGKALIIEYFMTSCSPCISAGATLEAMKADLMAEFPGMIKPFIFVVLPLESNSKIFFSVNFLPKSSKGILKPQATKLPQP